jgi:hypothetical protein
MPQAELEDLPLAGVQPGQGGPDEPAQLRPFGAVADIGGWVGEVSRLIEPRLPAAIANVSWTASAASSGSASIQRQ